MIPPLHYSLCCAVCLLCCFAINFGETSLKMKLNWDLNLSLSDQFERFNFWLTSCAKRKMLANLFSNQRTRTKTLFLSKVQAGVTFLFCCVVCGFGSYFSGSWFFLRMGDFVSNCNMGRSALFSTRTRYFLAFQSCNTLWDLLQFPSRVTCSHLSTKVSTRTTYLTD